MICQVIDDEEPFFGKDIEISLEDMCSDGSCVTEYQIFRNALLLKEVETLEETEWVLAEYARLRSKPRIVVMNVDPVVEALPPMLTPSKHQYYGNILKSGDSEIFGNFYGRDYGSVLHKVIFQMLLEDGVEFLEVKARVTNGKCFYDLIIHEEEREEVVDTLSEMTQFESEDNTVEEYLKNYLAQQ